MEQIIDGGSDRILSGRFPEIRARVMRIRLSRTNGIPVLLVVVGLLLFSGCGGSGEAERSVAGTPPDAVFTVTPETGSYPLDVELDASASSDSDGSIVEYRWAFGDGTEGSGITTSHTYAAVGEYTVMLTVKDNTGITASATRKVAVLGVFFIGGTITAPLHTAVDGDLNDHLAPYASNNTFEAAQLIFGPLTLGGYVNVPGSGNFGRSFVDGDTNDIFQASLPAGTKLELFIADTASGADLDLYLYDENRMLADASVGLEAVESLTVTSTGTFYIRIHAAAGASNYTLVIGQMMDNVAGVARDRLLLSDEFIPGEALVRYRPEVLASRNGMGYSTDQADALGLHVEAGLPEQELLVRFQSPPQRERALEALGIQPASGFMPLSSPGIGSDLQRKLETLLVVKALRKRTDIAAASPNLIRHSLMTPNDPLFISQWHYSRINLPLAWDLTTGRSDEIIAVVDTGVLIHHPDLEGQLVRGYDFISSPDIALDGDGMDPDPDDPGDAGPGGSTFHGTHVAGTIAAATNNGIGVAGVAGQCRIMPLRVLGKGGGTLFDILAAVRYAAGMENASGTVPERPASIINLSLGGATPNSLEESVFRAVRAAGVITVAAAGNSRSGTPIYPAAYDGVISVSAVTIEGTSAPYSNFGATISVAAPGGDLLRDIDGDGHGDGVLSSAGNDVSGTVRFTYSYYQGTSMAAPHVSGVLALMQSIYPSLNPDTLDALFAGGRITRDLGLQGWDERFGFGLIDALKAVQEAHRLKGDNGELPPALVVNPRSLNFGTGLNQLQLTAQNAGGGDLNITRVSSDADWLTVSPPESAGGQGAYTVTVKREGLSGGPHTASITFTSSANPVSVPVLIQSSMISGTGDVGYQYVLLIDPETFETLEQVNVGANNGFYRFEFDGVPFGKYLIYTGSDPNNDGLICDAGESCGAYMTLDRPIELEVKTDLSGIDFGAEYITGLAPDPAGRFSDGIRPLQRRIFNKVTDRKKRHLPASQFNER